jgi:hypothetical protein
MPKKPLKPMDPDALQLPIADVCEALNSAHVAILAMSTAERNSPRGLAALAQRQALIKQLDELCRQQQALLAAPK